MDVNGTRHFLRLGRADWQGLIPADTGLEWDTAFRGVRLQAVPFRFSAAAGPVALDPALRRGAASDAFGTWYWIDAERQQIRCWPSGQGAVGTFWSADELTRAACSEVGPTGFRSCIDAPVAAAPLLFGLTVTRDHYLLTGTAAPAGLLVFDLHGGGQPVWRPWQAGFHPLDMAAADDGGAWVLDFDPTDPVAVPRLWRLDCHFQPIGLGGRLPGTAPLPALFKPADGSAPSASALADIPLPLPLMGLVENPVSVVHLADTVALLLDNPAGASFSRLVLLHRGEAAAFDLRALVEGDDIRGHDMAFVRDAGSGRPGQVAGTLYVVGAAGNQAFALRLVVTLSDAAPRLDLTLVRDRYYPLRRFAGRALVAAAGAVHYDIGERWVPLAPQPQPLHLAEAVSAPLRLDSELHDCVWHRVTLDACVPNDSALSIEVRASNNPDELATLGWQTQPRPYLRAEGSELPWHEPFAPEALRTGTGTHETLLQNAHGRWLELRLRLSGNGRTTPRVRALRVHAPRFSYAERYLPAVYRQDAESAAFLERFLANPEGLWTSIEGRIASAEVLFDARTAPEEYLDWLAGWLGAEHEPDWDAARKRLFLAHAAELFRWRGTRSGLVAALRLVIDACPDAGIFADLGRSERLGPLAGYQVRIIEGHEERRLPGVVLGDATASASAVRSASTWQPADGATALHGRFRGYLAGLYPEDLGGLNLLRLNQAWGTGYGALNQVRFAPLPPTSAPQAADWRGFVAAGLGLPYAEVANDDAGAWRGFLRARYADAVAMNLAHGRAADSFDFDNLPLPDVMPEVPAALADWFAFAGLALPIARHAYRFTVLIPASPLEPPAVRDARLARASALVERERPAHADYQIKLYWALFRVGTARLGLDTVLGEGSRYTAIVLSAGHLGEGYLAESHPWNVSNRWVVGRDPINVTRSA
jgi:phage tail-like protein